MGRLGRFYSQFNVKTYSQIQICYANVYVSMLAYVSSAINNPLKKFIIVVLSKTI
jgi:hypothetical protein